MSQPLVSVIIPTYNYAHYINEAIDSVLKQTYPIESIEIIIVDDGSTDNTQDVLQQYDKNVVKYFYQHNQGKANATYKAIQHSSGKYLFNLDADDYYYAEKIAMSVAIFESDKDIVHVSSPAKTVYDDSDLIKIEAIPSEILDKPIDGNWLLRYFYTKHILFGGGSTYAARADALKKIVIPTNVDMYIDEFLILALFPYGKSYFIKEPLSIWRGHNSNYSGKANTAAKKEEKGRRLLSSSAGILTYLENNKFDSQLVKIYQLIDLTRRIAFKEQLGEKKVSDILKYGRQVFFKIRPDWQIIKRYYVINRFIPGKLLQALKKAKNSK